MASVNNTPPINATGAFEVLAPFAVESGAIYRCEAIVGFEALEGNGVDVFETYYSTTGVSNEVYLEDATNGINIITLISDTAATLVIPSSYISKFPTAVSVPYSRMVLSVDLGVLPDGVDLTSCMDVIASEVSEVIGVPTAVEAHKLSVEDAVSFSEHEMLELNRVDNIIVRETPFAALARMAIVEAGLRARIIELETIIIQQKTVIDGG